MAIIIVYFLPIDEDKEEKDDPTPLCGDVHIN